MFWKKKQDFVEWDVYQDKMAVWDAIGFAQKTRSESLKNMPGFAE